jgi:ATP-dependent helicase HrpB
MPFQYKHTNLPILEVEEELTKTLRNTNRVILEAPPGAGKSTLIPLMLLNEEWLKHKKILMLEPRRLAVKTIAERMASIIGEGVGDTIGYRIRFETKVSVNTKIEIITEGILTRMLQQDNALEDYGLLIFDEFHERSLHADLALSLSRESQETLREDLRILVMSATLNGAELKDILDAPIVRSEGRTFPVELAYAGDVPYEVIAERAASLVLEIAPITAGDILIFMPGEGEIKKCAQTLHQLNAGFQVHELFGRLSMHKQRAAILPDKQGRRKVVIATSIAETSLTIEGVNTVIDSGYSRYAAFDAKTGLSGLKTNLISLDIADQRAGRAGRLGPGKAYRLWSKSTHLRMKEHRSPEILGADLAPLQLELLNWGISANHDLKWVTPPPSHAMERALDLLESIDAAADGCITDHGKELQKLPTHPRIAHMLICAQEEGLLSLATDIAALLDVRDPMPQGTGIDLSLRIEALRRGRQDKALGRKFLQVEKLAGQYRSLFQLAVSNSLIDPYDVGLLLVHAYPERIAFARPGNNAQFQLANGKYVQIGHRDSLAHESWLAVAHMNDREHIGQVFLAAPLNPTDLKPFLKEMDVVRWDYKTHEIYAQKETKIGSILLKSIPIVNLDTEKVQKMLLEAIQKQGALLLNFDEKVRQWQNRVLTVKSWYANEDWPDTSTESLLMSAEDWILPYLENCKNEDDLKKINLFEVLHYSLPYDKQKKLDLYAPSKLTLSNSFVAKIEYQENAQPPILAIRIQDLFGVKKTPSVNEGKNNVLLHLLSPGYKPVQITSDLPSFWQNAYHDVRKDLRIRYKKHAWPENPFIY